MLFLVPDTEETPQETADAPQGADSALSQGKPQDEDMSGSIKVELDLDDAPFLNDFEEEEEEKEEEAAEEAIPDLTDAETEEEPKKGLLANKKKLLILTVALLLILAGGTGALFFFTGEEAEPEPEPADKRRVVVITDQPEEELSEAVQVVALAPFIIPSKGSEGEVRLLHCTLHIPFDDPVQQQEINARMLEIRNAIYYYLVNKPLAHLSSEEEATLLKQDLTNVLNELLTVKKIHDMYIQEYVITAP